MTPTVELLRAWFADFNVRYFGGALPMPLLKVSNARTTLGQFSRRKVRGGLLGLRSADECCISVSRYYDIAERELQNILLHEMIHFSISRGKVRDTSPHGVLFHREMDRLNAQGWHISVSTNTKGWAVSGGKRRSLRCVVVAATSRGCYIAAVQRPYVRAVDGVLARVGGFEQRRWYYTNDDYFQSLPLVRTPRLRRVGEAEFREVCARLEAQAKGGGGEK